MICIWTSAVRPRNWIKNKNQNKLENKTEAYKLLGKQKEATERPRVRTKANGNMKLNQPRCLPDKKHSFYEHSPSGKSDN